tara:strand:+ start:334 stop:531 length:198 start_codon:yes stop_codon:yes gene_type:complete
MKLKLKHETQFKAKVFFEKEEMDKLKDEIKKAEQDRSSDLNQMINRPTSFEDAEIASYIISKKGE